MKVCIIGGGLSGLMTAKKLSEKGFEVKVFENQERLGGLARTFEIDGFELPIFYHHIFRQDSMTCGLLKELNIETLKWTKIKMGVYTNENLYKISYLSALLWDFISFKDKVKLGLLQIKAKTRKNWNDIEGLSGDEWLEKVVGKNVKEKIFRNLMREKYGLDLDKISASELARRLSENEAKGVFTYPKKGLQKMIDGLKDRVEKNSGEVFASNPVERVDLNNGSITTLEKEHKFDILVNTAPIPIFLNLCRGLPKNYRQRLSMIKYCRNICVDVGLEEHLSEYYWINCFKQVLGGIIEHTKIADLYQFKMAWLWKYAPSDQIWNLSDEKVEKLFVENLKKIFPNIKVKWIRTFRSEYASPLYDINYKNYMPDYKTPLKNLFFSGIAITYPKIRNMNIALESGIKTAEIILKEFGEKS